MSRPRFDRRAFAGYIGLAFLAYVPVLRAARGQVAADTKQYLYLDPARLLGRAVTMWDPNIGMGTVTHQTVGYVFPMGPYYWTFEKLGVPDWVAQRLWLGSLMFAAGLGVLYLLRTFGLRGPGVVIAALAYMFSPYSLDYAARISVLLMPWAALPWMIALVRKALKDGGWRYPAIFALVVQIVGGVNATALVFAGIGPLLWLVYSAFVAHEVPLKRALTVTAKTGVLTIATSLWWIAGLSIQGQYGLNVLRYTETVEAVAKTSTPNEILRGLGYWFFYGQDRLGPWIESSNNYTQRPAVILAGYGLVALALLAAGFVRWRHKIFFVAMMLAGVIVAAGAHPYGSPTPLGGVFKAFANSSTAGLALRSTARAVPLVVLSIAVLLGLGVNAVNEGLRRIGRPRLVIASVALVVVMILVNFPALVDGTFYGKNLQRPEAVPGYWKEAAAHLDTRGNDTRVLELPGTDFSSYRWGNTVDPITPGLMDRPYVARELIPWGSPATANLLNALDHRIQDQVLDPAGFAAVARRMGVGDVLLRNDLQYERFDVVSARDIVREFTDVPGLGAAVPFGPPSAPQLYKAHEDERTLGAPAGEAPPAPVVVYPVDDATPIVRGESTAQALMIAGDGEGLIDAADLGLVDDAGIIQYTGSYATPTGLRGAVEGDTTLVLTDSNRRQARRWTSVRDNTGVTEQAGEEAITDDPGDARLELFPDATEDSFTTIDQQGVRWATASSYGNIITYTPEDSAARAFDGDVDTAWRAGGFGSARGQHIRLELDRPITTDRIGLVQTLTRGRDRYITEATLRFDGGNDVVAKLDGSSRTEDGQVVAFPRRRFRTLDIEVTGLNTGEERLQSSSDAVGFAEIRVRDEHANRDIRVDEVVRMPTDLLSALGRSSQDNPLVVVMSRNRVLPIPPRSDPEPAIAREFTLPDARDFALTGDARISSEADADTIAAVLGRPGANRTDASATMPGCVACRVDAAFDGDATTAWQTPFKIVRGQWVGAELEGPVTLDHLELAVVADGRHSVPTKVTLQVDDATQTLTLPEIADSPEENATAVVPLTFAPMTGRSIRVTIDDVREMRTFDFYAGAETLLPAAIAEVGAPGVPIAPAPPAALPGDCRDDLLRIDDQPVPTRVTGSTADAIAGRPLTIETCAANDGRAPAITLAAGAHEVRAAPGAATAIALDRLAFASAAGGAAGEVADGRVVTGHAGPPPAPEVCASCATAVRACMYTSRAQPSPSGSCSASPTAPAGARRPTKARPSSACAGWSTATRTAGSSIRTRRASTSSWSGRPSSECGRRCGFRSSPPSGAWSSPSSRGSVAAPRGAFVQTAEPEDAFVELVWPLDRERPVGVSRRVRIAVPIGVGVVAGIAAAPPWIGLVVAITTAFTLGSRVGRLVLAAAPGVLVAICGLYIAWGEQRHKIPAIFEWPTVFPRARSLAWLAVLLAVSAVVVEVTRRRAAARAVDTLRDT